MAVLMDVFIIAITTTTAVGDACVTTRPERCLHAQSPATVGVAMVDNMPQQLTLKKKKFVNGEKNPQNEGDLFTNI